MKTHHLLLFGVLMDGYILYGVKCCYVLEAAWIIFLNYMPQQVLQPKVQQLAHVWLSGVNC